MADIPSPLTYATITLGTFSFGADSADVGSAPDISLPSGTVTITPNVRIFKTTSGTPELAFAETIVGQVVAGVLYAPDGATTLRVLATDSPGIDPTDFQYTATFKLKNVPDNPGSVTFSAPGGSTVNLASVVSVAPAPPTSATLVTTDDLAAALADYVLSSALTTTLTGYTTDAEHTALTATVAGHTSTLSTHTSSISSQGTSIGTLQSQVLDLISRVGGFSVIAWNGTDFKAWDGNSYDAAISTSAAEIRWAISAAEVTDDPAPRYSDNDIWDSHEDQPEP